jgi:hypothetical protein
VAARAGARVDPCSRGRGAARLGLGNLIPGTAIGKPSELDPGKEALEVLGAPGGVIKSLGYAGQSAARGDWYGEVAAAEQHGAQVFVETGAPPTASASCATSSACPPACNHHRTHSTSSTPSARATITPTHNSSRASNAIYSWTTSTASHTVSTRAPCGARCSSSNYNTANFVEMEIFNALFFERIYVHFVFYLVNPGFCCVAGVFNVKLSSKVHRCYIHPNQHCLKLAFHAGLVIRVNKHVAARNIDFVFKCNSYRLRRKCIIELFIVSNNRFNF